MNFQGTLINTLLIAFGVITGASICAGIGALINENPPLKAMLDTAKSIKTWAIAVALGDTFASFEVLEQGLFNWQIRSLIKQILYIIAAIIGANCGLLLLNCLQRCVQLWSE